MKCLGCNCEKFELQDHRISTKVKNELINVIVPCNICQKCGSPFVDSYHMNLLRKAASDKYRELHNLLTSKEIIQFRDSMGMSQLAFAEYLNVGEASIKRWESYFIQEVSHDDHIRIKCDLSTAVANFLTIREKQEKEDDFNGRKIFSLETYNNLTKFFKNTLGACEEYLSKLHFYADFLNFKHHHTGITGNKYIPLKSGPCQQYYLMFPYYPTTHTKKIDFDAKELKSIEHLCRYYKQNGGAKIQEMACKEHAFTSANEHDYLNYADATKLLI